MTDIKKLVSQNKIHFIYGCIILILIIGLVMCYKFSQNSASTPPVATITDISPAGVAAGQVAAGKYTGAADAADVSNLIQKAQQSAPTAIYYTTTQAAADKQAQVMAKADKADYVLKETAVPKSGVGVTAENSAVKNEEITNNYYAITQERKHRIAVGATVIDSKPYATIAYTNDRLTYEIHSKDLKQIDGGSVLYTVKKW